MQHGEPHGQPHGERQHPENRPSSDKARRVIEELERQGTQGPRWRAIMTAVDGAIQDAGVQNVSDSEKAELLFYLGGKIQSCSVI